jgi:hypothetical protein
MTKREAAIVSAYTGVLIGKFSDMQSYVEEKFGPVFTHEFGDDKFCEKLRKATKDDFLNISVE